MIWSRGVNGYPLSGYYPGSKITNAYHGNAAVTIYQRDTAQRST